MAPARKRRAKTVDRASLAQVRRRVRDLAALVNSLKTTIDEETKDGKGAHAALRKGIDDVRARQDTQDAKVEAALREFREDVMARMLEDAKARMGHLGAIDQSLESVDRKFGNGERRFGRIENEIAGLRSDFRSGFEAVMARLNGDPTDTQPLLLGAKG